MQNMLYAKAVMSDREREIRQRMRERRYAQHRQQSESVRQVVGRSIVRIGHRIAAEPQPRLARSR